MGSSKLMLPSPPCHHPASLLASHDMAWEARRCSTVTMQQTLEITPSSGPVQRTILPLHGSGTPHFRPSSTINRTAVFTTLLLTGDHALGKWNGKPPFPLLSITESKTPSTPPTCLGKWPFRGIDGQLIIERPLVPNNSRHPTLPRSALAHTLVFKMFMIFRHVNLDRLSWPLSIAPNLRLMLPPKAIRAANLLPHAPPPPLQKSNWGPPTTADVPTLLCGVLP
ncbi:uncharacterized protein CLUP02_00775 [Colletotrichum lupini]|uniref:Uncharacterized protein n=1 Tax=Colletotrichum lupini TaxID=145971 RepID=A0A9Q8SBP8_9PEZI|nr:uncharacterized protein CLUP02_00775 [Colletotrichum lupini]UQC74128.1 hypothetical protein CLUP02_00775 [Colletotrichum lupini]